MPTKSLLEKELIFFVGYIAGAVIFGYCFHGSRDNQPLKISELTVASAIVAMGATRQACSHCTAAISMGNSTTDVENVVAVASELAQWNRHPLGGEIDVKQLAVDLDKNLRS